MILNGSSSWRPSKTTPLKDIERVKARFDPLGYNLVEVDSSGPVLPDEFRSLGEKTLAFQPCECGSHTLVEQRSYERNSGSTYREYVTRWCEECGVAR